jgi:hypothetical protein
MMFARTPMPSKIKKKTLTSETRKEGMVLKYIQT